MKHKKIFLVGLLLLAIITIGAVSATDALAVDDSGGVAPDDSLIVENGGGVADDSSDSSSKNVLGDEDDGNLDDGEGSEDEDGPKDVKIIRTHHYRQDGDLLYVNNETIDITVDITYDDEDGGDVDFITGSLVDVYLDGNYTETVKTVNNPDFDMEDLISNNHVIISGIEKGKTYTLMFIYNGTEEYNGANETYLIKRVDCIPGFSITVPLALEGENNTAEVILYDTAKGLYYYDEELDEYISTNESYIYDKEFEVSIYSVEYNTNDEGDTESSETLLYSGNHTTGIINLPGDLTEGNYILEANFVGDNDTYLSAKDRCSFSVNILYPYVFIVTAEEVVGENTTAEIYSTWAIRDEYDDDGTPSYYYYPVSPFDCELLVYLNNESYANVNCNGRFYNEMRGLYMSYAELNISGLKKGENVLKAVYDGSEGNFTAVEYICSYGTLTRILLDAPEDAVKGEDYEFTVSLQNLEDDSIINENFNVIVSFDSQTDDEDEGTLWVRTVLLNETVCGNATLTISSEDLEKYNRSYFEIHASFECENYTYSSSEANKEFNFFKVYAYISLYNPDYVEGEDYTFNVSLLDKNDDSIIYRNFNLEVYYYGDEGDEYLWQGTVNGTKTLTITDEEISQIKEYVNCFNIHASFYDEDNEFSSSYVNWAVYFDDEPGPVDEIINDITFDGPPSDGTIIEIIDRELIIAYILIPEWDDTVVGVNMTVNGELVYVNSTATMEKEYLPLSEAYRYAVYMNYSQIKDKDIFVFQLDCYDDDIYWVYVAKVEGNNLVFYDDYSGEINYYVFYGNITDGDLNDPEAMGPHPNGHFLELEIPDSCGITEGTVTISDGSKTLYTKSLSEIKEGYSYFVLGNSYAINLTDFDFSILPENKNLTVTFSSGNTTLSEKRIKIGDYVYLVNTPERIARYYNITGADETLIYGSDTVISIIATDELNPQSAVIDAGGGYFNVYVNGERIEDLGSLFEFDDEEEEYIPTELELGILGLREYRYFYLSLDDLGIFEDGKYNIRVTQYPGDADSSDNELSEYFYSTETEVLNKDITVRFITLTNVVTPELFKYYVDKYGTLTDKFDELIFVGNFSNISCKYLGITSPVTLIGQNAYFENLFFEIAAGAENVTIRNMTLNYTDAINSAISVGELSKFVLEGNTINYDCKYQYGRAIVSDADNVSVINNVIYAYGRSTAPVNYNIGVNSITAIDIMSGDNLIIDNNRIIAKADNYTSTGVYIGNTADVTLSNNMIMANKSINLRVNRAAVNHNAVEGYIEVYGDNNTISYNNITTSEEYAIDLGDSTGNIVTNNNLFAQKTGNEAVKTNNNKNTIADNNLDKISSIILTDIVFDYGASGSTIAVISHATNITGVKVLDKLKNVVNATISINGLKITVSGLDAGTYTLSATTVPESDYEVATATAGITVNKVDSTLNADNIAFVYGQSGSTTVSYTGADDVSAVIAGHADSVTREGNVITVSNLDAGIYVLTVATVADANHNPVSRDLSVNVSKAQSTLSVDNITFIFDAVGKGTVNYTGAIGVSAEILNHPEAPVTVNGNEITVSNLETGKYKLVVTTTVDANHESVTRTADVTVTKTPSTLSVGDVVYDYGNTGYTTANFTGATAVTASVVNHTEAVVTVNGNEISVTGLDPGNYQLMVSTVPDADHESVSASSNITVNKLSTSINAAKVTATYAVSKNLVITLTANGAALSGKYVTVTVGSIKKTLKTNAKGQVSVKVSGLVPKTYTATVKFAGDANYTGTSKKVSVVVKKNTPKVTAKNKSFKRTVKTKSYSITIKNSQNKVIKGIKASIKVNGVTYSATSNAKGVATFKITKLTKKGSFKSTITVKATSYYNKVTKKVTIKAT